MAEAIYQPDLSLKGKLRRRLVRLDQRRPAKRAAGRPMVSFAFDDVPETAITVGGAILERLGVRGSFFVSAGLAGGTGHLGRYATRDQVQHASRMGHEIACHTYSHLDCARMDDATIRSDIERNSATLMEWGAPRPTTFAYPYGDVSSPAKRAASERFDICRALHHGLVGAGVDLNQAPAIGIEGEGGEALARHWMDRARARGEWVILFTHGVEPQVTRFGASVDAFTRLAQTAVAQGFDVVTVAEGARRLGAAT